MVKIKILKIENVEQNYEEYDNNYLQRYLGDFGLNEVTEEEFQELKELTKYYNNTHYKDQLLLITEVKDEELLSSLEKFRITTRDALKKQKLEDAKNKLAAEKREKTKLAKKEAKEKKLLEELSKKYEKQ